MPTINYGSILQMFCVGYTDTLTMSVPLQVLPSLAADFDGKVRSIRKKLRYYIAVVKALELLENRKAISSQALFI